ncbi:hypothetical protein CCP3SC1_510017 [Gammaproteobacteria bacterium]
MSRGAGFVPARAPSAGESSIVPVPSNPAIPGRGVVVAVAGSRSLPPTAAPLVSAVCQSIFTVPGRSLAVGCAVGVDAAVLTAGLSPATVRCFAAFGPVPKCAGSWSGSARAAVSKHAAAGGSVAWFAGGDLVVPLRARLAGRTAAVIGAASAGCVVFFTSPESRGTLLATKLAITAGLPVWAFAIGFPWFLLPRPVSGIWTKPNQTVEGIWSSAVVWRT